MTRIPGAPIDSPGGIAERHLQFHSPGAPGQRSQREMLGPSPGGVVVEGRIRTSRPGRAPRPSAKTKVTEEMAAPEADRGRRRQCERRPTFSACWPWRPERSSHARCPQGPAQRNPARLARQQRQELKLTILGGTTRTRNRDQRQEAEGTRRPVGQQRTEGAGEGPKQRCSMRFRGRDGFLPAMRVCRNQCRAETSRTI